jgi:hypothetical protein
MRGVRRLNGLTAPPFPSLGVLSDGIAAQLRRMQRSQAPWDRPGTRQLIASPTRGGRALGASGAVWASGFSRLAWRGSGPASPGVLVASLPSLAPPNIRMQLTGRGHRFV